jgi:hypothetical protein
MATIAAATLTAAAATPAHSAAAAGTSPWDVPTGIGATVPFTQYEAERATTTGTLVGPDYTQGTVPSEASGRQAVRLASPGQYVEFTLTNPANAVTVAYNVPQGASGSLSVYVNGSKLSQKLPLTSRFLYLDTPWIAGSKTHHLFAHERLRLGNSLAAGAKVRLQIDAGDLSGAVIDTADFEDVPAAAQPANSVSVTSTGADPTGAGDSTNAFNQAISTARSQGKSVWIPAGDFKITSPLQIDSVTMRGAGPWYSVLRGTHLIDNSNTQGAIKLYDFAAIGEVTSRNDSSPDNFVNGSLGNGSVVSNIWIQHQKVGLWLVGPNNTNLTIENSRFLDLTADGVNFNGTVSNSAVRNNYLRNTGDDSLAMWSLHSENTTNTFANNTIVQPNLANGIAIYGGRDTTLSKNVVADTNALGSGIAISNQQFIAGQGFTPLAGTINVTDNTIIRGGAMNPNWQHPMSAIRFDSYDYAISSGVMVNLTGGQILESPYSAIEVVSGGGTGKPVTSLKVDGTTINGARTVAVQVETQGSGSFSNVVASGIGAAGIYNCPYPQGSGTFTFNFGVGNSGWSDSVWPGCTFPDPVDPSGLAVSPSSVDFGSQDLGTTSTAKPVSITNRGSSAVAIQGITASGDFAQTNNCGTLLAAGASCTAQVTFKPTAAGTRTGTLTISSDAPGSPNTVKLSGSGVDPSGNLAAGRTVTATSSLSAYPASNAVDGNASSYWESNNNAFPQSLTVDLGTSRTVARVVLKLPPDPAWGARTQTLSVSGSTDGSAYSTIVGSTGYRFDPATGNTVTINFTQTSQRYLRLTFTANTGWPAAQLSEFEVYAASSGTNPPPSGNLALGKATAESSHTQVYGSANAVDGNAGTYWESANNAFPQWLQVDLGTAQTVGRIVLKLPPDSAWAARTQTLSVSGSGDGSTFTTIVGSAQYRFDPATGNTVTITFAQTSQRYLRLTFTANTAWPAGQVSEFEVYAP